ncbi:ATP synthase subunit I [Lachnospiraceae bacterium OttesenSCG-928-D06]|nr:ATP synthase subunit I [Lachnospiraceae bacterium OttesenSCG-928-D06]
MGILERLRQKNRTLLEMQAGILFWGVVCQIVGAFIVTNPYFYMSSLWFGILLALVSSVHMYRSLDTALDMENPQKMITRGYMIRYVALIVILGIIMWTNVLNPLVVFMAYMGLKVAAFIQPFTHKLSNKVFNETDPIPMPMEEEVDVSTPETGQEN